MTLEELHEKWGDNRYQSALEKVTAAVLETGGFIGIQEMTAIDSDAGEFFDCFKNGKEDPAKKLKA